MKINLHIHSTHSFNAQDLSPAEIAHMAMREGFDFVGIVDFDTLSGIPGFFHAGKRLRLKTCASIESRVFVPQLSNTVINSPGERGVLYHIGIGFTREIGHPFLDKAWKISESRMQEIVEKVNDYLHPVRLNYSSLQKLTPRGNVTERHVCRAYREAALEVFPINNEHMIFWEDKLGECPEDNKKLEALIRSKTMKQGGAGYTPPSEGSFPELREMNQFILDAGAIPTLAWLDGTSDGEKDADKLLEFAVSEGIAAINIIPDRNHKPGDAVNRSQKYLNLLEIVEKADRLGFPVIVGTEMNAPGHKTVDDFDSPELKPLLPIFKKGTEILYGHTVLQRHCKLGYLSEWAKNTFRTVFERNEFFSIIGQIIGPQNEDKLTGFDSSSTPIEIQSA